ncbi:hypothetical protein [Pontiella agarivorans]|uniref:Uncharacterized protein n=1 Tax=Pontiella agarivorans TaxID=3038953 RepID=A0ABU5MVP5_9BACT|nr:hypothetical protein [Pontiella agarivorans]MDZ8118237.1 hypothetical protein [Pontiella agarivorans]
MSRAGGPFDSSAASGNNYPGWVKITHRKKMREPATYLQYGSCKKNGLPV